MHESTYKVAQRHSRRDSFRPLKGSRKRGRNICCRSQWINYEWLHNQAVYNRTSKLERPNARNRNCNQHKILSINVETFVAGATGLTTLHNQVVCKCMQMKEKAFAKILVPSKQQISTKSMQMQETELAINNKIEHLKNKCRKETRVKKKNKK